MLCPVCRTELLALEFENVEVDWCAACGGLWFDAGELGLILRGQPGLDETAWLGAGEPGRRPCPLCRDTMRRATTPEGAVEIDVCPHRHGLWLDRGELERIGAAAGADAARLAAFCARLFPPAASKTPGSL